MANRIQKIAFMMKKLSKDVHRGKEIYAEAEDVHSELLGEYYFVMDEGKLRAGYSQNFSFDKDGIPMIPTYIDVEDSRLVYYPISIGQFGLAVFHTYLKSKKEADLARFLQIAEWFCQNDINEERLGIHWLTEVPKPEYRIDRPWPSAFTQSRAISVLMRAFQSTKTAKYRDFATAALKIFTISALEGGVTSFTAQGPIYEEYPAPFPTMVLDGSIFSLFGLYDYVRAMDEGSPEARMAAELFESGAAALAGILPHYDLGYWIRYNLCQEDFYPGIDPATVMYFRMILAQLNILHRITGNEEFARIRAKWQQYDRFGSILRMYFLKYRALRQLNRV